MTESEARDFFLEKIRNRLAEEGRPLAGLELEYWKVLRPTDEESLDKLLSSNEDSRKEFGAIEDKFESTLYEAISHDLAVDSTARKKYIAASQAISSVEGIQLQAIVSAATLKFKELDDWKAWQHALLVIGILALVALGGWIGVLLRR